MGKLLQSSCGRISVLGRATAENRWISACAPPNNYWILRVGCPFGNRATVENYWILRLGWPWKAGLLSKIIGFPFGMALEGKATAENDWIFLLGVALEGRATAENYWILRVGWPWKAGLPPNIIGLYVWDGLGRQGYRRKLWDFTRGMALEGRATAENY